MTFGNHILIYMQAALTYAEAQLKIDDPTMHDEVTSSLRRLNSLAKILKKRRVDNGWASVLLQLEQLMDNLFTNLVSVHSLWHHLRSDSTLTVKLMIQLTSRPKS